MKKRNSFLLVNIFLFVLISNITTPVYQFPSGNFDLINLLEEDYEIVTSDPLITHDFNINSTYNMNSTSLDKPRGITVGKPHPDGEFRIILGSAQTTDFSMQVLKPIDGDVYNYTFEGRYEYSNKTSDLFEPIFTYDFDSDGVEEIFGSQGDPYTNLFIGWNGTGYWPKWTNISDTLVFHKGGTIFDIDRDGEPELITYSYTQTAIYSWDHGFVNFRQDAILSGGSYGSLGIGDIDNDGETEIVTAMTGTDSSIRMYGFNGTGYELEFNNSYDGYSRGFSSLCTSDINNDGMVETFAGTPNWLLANYPLVMFTWNGSSLNVENIHVASAAHYQSVVGDIDSDGFNEIIFDRNGDSSLVVEVASNGSIVVQEYWIIDGYMWLELEDLDGDYIPEIIMGFNQYHDYDNPVIATDNVSHPPIIYKPKDQTFTNLDTFTLKWIPVCRSDKSFKIYMDGSMIEEGNDITDVPLESTFIRLSPGVYNLTIDCWDSSNRHVITRTWITIENGDFVEPTIKNVNWTESMANQDIFVYADIFDDAGIDNAVVVIFNDSDRENFTMTYSEGVYSANIGSWDYDTTIIFYIEAEDIWGNTNKEGNYTVKIESIPETSVTFTSESTSLADTSTEVSTSEAEITTTISNEPSSITSTPFHLTPVTVLLLVVAFTVYRRRK